MPEPISPPLDPYKLFGAKMARASYTRPAEKLAVELLGRVLVRRLPDGSLLAGRIVETEAYLGIPDKAAHTYNGRRTERVRSMWADGGTLYVYRVYGMHRCANVVAGHEGEPVAVLLRALEPIQGLQRMRSNRPKAKRDTDLCSGPAKLCQAMEIEHAHDGTDLVESDWLSIRFGQAERPRRIVHLWGPRVGVGYAQEWADRPLRFWVADCPHVSR